MSMRSQIISFRINQLPIPALTEDAHLAVLCVFVPYELRILSRFIVLDIGCGLIFITPGFVLLVAFGIFTSPIFGVSFIVTNLILLHSVGFDGASIF